MGLGPSRVSVGRLRQIRAKEFTGRYSLDLAIRGRPRGSQFRLSKWPQDHTVLVCIKVGMTSARGWVDLGFSTVFVAFVPLLDGFW